MAGKERRERRGYPEGIPRTKLLANPYVNSSVSSSIYTHPSHCRRRSAWLELISYIWWPRYYTC